VRERERDVCLYKIYIKKRERKGMSKREKKRRRKKKCFDHFHQFIIRPKLEGRRRRRQLGGDLVLIRVAKVDHVLVLTSVV